MAKAKVAVTIDERVLREVDRWVASGDYPNRSQAVQAGLAKLAEEREAHASLLAELVKLDPAEERSLAEEWLPSEAEWPAY